MPLVKEKLIRENFPRTISRKSHHQPPMVVRRIMKNHVNIERNDKMKRKRKVFQRYSKKRQLNFGVLSIYCAEIILRESERPGF